MKWDVTEKATKVTYTQLHTCYLGGVICLIYFEINCGLRILFVNFGIEIYVESYMFALHTNKAFLW